MKALPVVIRKTVAKAKETFASALVTVRQYPVTSKGPYGPVRDTSPTEWQAVVKYSIEAVSMPDGSTLGSKVQITILEPVPVDDWDQFEVPDLKGGWLRLDVLGLPDTVVAPDGTSYITIINLGHRGAVR